MSDLHTAIENGDLDRLIELIDSRTSLEEIDETNYIGYSPLDLAAELGNLKIVQILLSEGVDVDYSQESSPLHMAVNARKYKVVKELINAGANLEFEVDDGYTPLMNAILNDDLRMIKILVDDGANIHAVDRDGFSVLDLAVQSGNTEIIMYLLDFIPNENIKNKEELLVEMCSYAISYGNYEEVVRMCDQGIDVDSADSEGTPLIVIAAENGQFEIIRELVVRGADIHSKSRASGVNALMAASENRHYDVVKFLLENGADPNSQCLEGMTPLMYTISPIRITSLEGDTRINTINALLDSGADISIKDSEGNSVIDLAKRISGLDDLIEIMTTHADS